MDNVIEKISSQIRDDGSLVAIPSPTFVSLAKTLKLDLSNDVDMSINLTVKLMDGGAAEMLFILPAMAKRLIDGQSVKALDVKKVEKDDVK